ncbi:hypothetical protein PF008_g19784 [Phytophthora fragariae]|nr:hypothetical protein PF008_g19784 [Phytophthora fragariae]
MSMTVYEEFVKVCPEVRAVSLEEPLTCKGVDGKPIERQLDLFVANAAQNEQDDEFDDVDEPQIGSSAVLSEDLLAAVETLIEIAIEKGFPKEKLI